MQEEPSGPIEVNVNPHSITPSDETERELLLRYLERKRKDLDRLEHAISNEDYALIHRIGHNLAGSGAAYGLPRVSHIGRQIEAASGRRNSAEVARYVAELRRFLSTVTVTDPE